VGSREFSRFPLPSAHNAVMRKRVYIALAVVLVALAGVSVWQGLRLREPVYQGKSASYWMNYDYSVPNPDREFREVWQGLGSNAVPFLVKALDRREAYRPITYRSLWRGLPPWLRRVLPTPSPPANIIRSRAASALGEIGEASRPAISAILHTMKTDESGFVRETATNALKQINPEAAAKAGVK
jgi:hypothetical protein